MATAVTLSRYAEIRAEMEAGALRDAALARAGITPDDWTAAQREWLGKMGAEIERGRFELTNEYTRTFLDTQRQLTEKPKLRDAAPAPAAPVSPTSFTPRAPDAPAVRVELPSFALPSAAPAPAASRLVMPGVPVKRAPSALAGTSLALGPQGPVVPFAPAPPAAPAPAPPGAAIARPVVNRAPAALTGTSKDLVLPKGPVVPFAAPAVPAVAAPAVPASPPAPPGSASPMVPKRPPAELAGTSLAFEMPKLPAMPFAAKAPAAVTVAPTPPAPTLEKPPATVMPVPKRPPAALTGTSMAMVPPKGPVVPFAGAPSGSPPAPPPPAAAPAPQAAAASAPAVAPLLVGGLTLEQHVSLCAEMAFDSARAPETLARYRTTVEAKADLDRQWRERFATDRQLEARWHEAFRVYTEFLRSQRQHST